MANHEKKKGSCLKSFIISFLVVIIVFIALAVLFGSSDNSDSNDTSIETVTDSSTDEDTHSNSEDTAEVPDSNTSAMVDYIASEAKKSANQSASEEKLNEALEFISSNYPNFFTDNETMEKTMYYGYYLEYAYSKNGEGNLYANLGMDTYQAVKYVYRNTETTEDPHVQENLSQIRETLSSLGYTVE